MFKQFIPSIKKKNACITVESEHSGNGKAYIVGGELFVKEVGDGIIESDKSKFPCAQVVNLQTGDWKDLPTLNIPRTEATICMSTDRKLYIAGGKSLENTEILNSVECLDLTLPSSQ